MEGYCVKCKAKVEMQDPEETTTKRGTKMMKGKCPTCNTTVCRIVGGGGKKKAQTDDKKVDDTKTDDTDNQNDDTSDDQDENTDDATSQE